MKTRTRLMMIALLSSLLLAVLVMLPRLLDPRFGLLDDGATIETVQTIAGGNWITWDIQGGRFRPGYWAFWLMLYLVGGKNPLIFFLGNTVLLAGISVLLTALIGLWTRRWGAGLLASAILLTSPPSAELFYTLSKGEGLQVFWILVALLMITLFSRRRDRGVLATVLAALAMLAACLSKETGVIVLPLSFAAAAINFLQKRRTFRWQISNPYLQAASAALASSAVFLIWRTMVLRKTAQDAAGYAGNYAIEIRTFLVSAYRWAGLLLSDFPYLLLLPLGALLVWKRMRTGSKQVLLLAILWTAAWVAVFFPWDGITVYFEFPAAVGIAVFAALILAEVIPTLRESRSGRRIVISGAIAGILLLLGASIGNALTDGIIQLSTDAVNWEAVEAAAALAPEDGLLLVNIQDSNEYIYELPIHLRIFHDREDLAVDIVRLDEFPPESPLPITLLAPYMQGAPVLTVRTGVVEPYIGIWDDSLQERLGEDVQTVAAMETANTLFSFKLPQLLCGFVNAETYCRGEPRALDLLDYSYGWRIYQLP